VAALIGGAQPAAAQEVEGELVVFNAGSLAVPFQRLLAAFEASHPEVRSNQEHSGSLAAVRKVTEFNRTPDVLAIADRTLFPRLLQPTHVTWYATFARNAMVVATSPRVPPEDRATTETWPQVFLDPNVRWGLADPAVDPAGYRALIVFDLAGRHYAEPELGQRLRDRVDARFVRPKSADLVALLQLGELDYALVYASLARLHGLPTIELPDAVNLSSPAYADVYREASVIVPGRTWREEDRIEVKGSVIEFALTVPREAPHRETGLAFVRFVLSDAGREILQNSGLVAIQQPMFDGAPPDELRP